MAQFFRSFPLVSESVCKAWTDSCRLSWILWAILQLCREVHRCLKPTRMHDFVGYDIKFHIRILQRIGLWLVKGRCFEEDRGLEGLPSG